MLLHAIVERQYLLLTNQIQNIDQIGNKNYFFEQQHSTFLDQTVAWLCWPYSNLMMLESISQCFEFHAVNTVEDTVPDDLTRTRFQVPCHTSYLALVLDALVVATFVVALAIQVETDCPDSIVAQSVTVRSTDLELSASTDNSAQQQHFVGSLSGFLYEFDPLAQTLLHFRSAVSWTLQAVASTLESCDYVLGGASKA